MYLKDLRLKRRLTLQEVAKACHISFSHLAKVENGVRKCSAKNKQALVDFYGESFELPKMPTLEEFNAVVNELHLLQEKYNTLHKNHGELFKAYEECLEVLRNINTQTKNF